MEKICTPADASLLQNADAMGFLRNLKDWSVGKSDRQAIEQLLTFVEDRLGFQVFEAIEGTKRVLSERDEALFHYDYPTIEIDEPIARAAFEQSSARATEAIATELDATLNRAGLTPSDVDIVCCTGGTARLPAVEQALAQRFGREKLTQFSNFHSVILGLSEYARTQAASTPS
jgi:hypothetical chaperone protein